MRTFEIVLRRPNLTDRVRYDNRADAEIGDVVTVEGRSWVIIDKAPLRVATHRKNHLRTGGSGRARGLIDTMMALGKWSCLQPKEVG